MTQTLSDSRAHPTSGPRRRPRPEPTRRVVARRRVDGTVIDAVALDPQIFGIEPNAAVLHQVVTAQLAAARAGTQSTKTRSEVRGGGAKPFRQKGTGRARQGSIRSPQWTGGGVALGPKPRTYRQRTPKKMIRLALASALSDRAGEGRVALVDEWSFAAPKTKDAVSALAALGLRGKVLVVLGPDDGIPDRSFANLRDVRRVQRTELNAYDVVRSDWVVFTDTTLPGETSPAKEDEAAELPEPVVRTPSAEPPATPRRSRTRPTRSRTKTQTDGPPDGPAEPTAEEAGDIGADAADATGDAAAEAVGTAAGEAADAGSADAEGGGE